MPFIDQIAKDRLAEMREAAGFTQEGLAAAIKRKADSEGWTKPDGIGSVDAFTIRRVERDGHVPSPRVRLVVALFFNTRPELIWDPRNRYEPAGQEAVA